MFTFPFPIARLSVSFVLAAFGLWLALRRWRYSGGAEPRCGKCDYLLIGLPGDRCPECGSSIQRPQSRRGRRRRSPVRAGLGLLLVVFSVMWSWKPTMYWWDSIYWYQYRPTSMLMDDLKRGAGMPPPDNYPLQVMAFSHGWPDEEADLGRAALEELIERDQAGRLSAQYRHEIDEMAVANFFSPARAPVGYFLAQELTHRLASGKLTAEEQAKIYKDSVAVTFAVDPMVIQWSPPPLQIGVKTRLPGGLCVETTYPSIRIDGREVKWFEERWPRESYDVVNAGLSATFDRFLPSATLGQHRIDLEVQIDVRGSARAMSLHHERRRFRGSFVVIKPPPILKAVWFVCDPSRQACHYLPVSWLQTLVAHGTLPSRDLAFEELVLRDQHGDLPVPQAASLVEKLLLIQKDRTQQWNGKFGDYIESLHGARRLAAASWHQYEQRQLSFYIRARPEIRQGDVLPLEEVTVARRGNSRVSAFSADQSSFTVAIMDYVPGGIRLEYGPGGECICVPHNRPEFSREWCVVLPGASVGRHTLRATLKYDPTWTERPQGMEIPAEYDLGQAEFTVRPRCQDSIRSVSELSLAQQISKCIAVSDLLRWDNGQLSLSIDVHRPPVDVAFHVSISAGKSEWDLGHVFAAKGCESNSVYDGFGIKDARQMPARGLFFHFRSDPDLARRSVDLHECWNGEFVVGPISIDRDYYPPTK